MDAPRSDLVTVDRLYGPGPGGKRIHIVAYGALEWTFLAILVVLVGAAGAFAGFLVTQLFRAHSRRT